MATTSQFLSSLTVAGYLTPGRVLRVVLRGTAAGPLDGSVLRLPRGAPALDLLLAVCQQTGARPGATALAVDGVVLRLTDGDMVTVDSAVAGIGAQPADGWLALSGLPVDDGLVCDSRCRVLGHDEIYAAGDIARWLHPRHRELVRVEHWTNAVEQAQFVARQIVSPSADEFTPVEYVWSDQYDWKIQIAGRPERGTADHLIDQPDRSRFCALYVARNGALTGLLTVNWPKAAIVGRRALAADLSPSGLRDQITRI